VYLTAFRTLFPICDRCRCSTRTGNDAHRDDDDDDDDYNVDDLQLADTDFSRFSKQLLCGWTLIAPQAR
jgi:hypothetical protein